MQVINESDFVVKPSSFPVYDESIAVEFGQMGKMEYGEIAYIILSLSQGVETDEWSGIPYSVLLKSFDAYAVMMVNEGWLEVVVDGETSRAFLTPKAIEFMRTHCK